MSFSFRERQREKGLYAQSTGSSKARKLPLRSSLKFEEKSSFKLSIPRRDFKESFSKQTQSTVLTGSMTLRRPREFDEHKVSQKSTKITQPYALFSHRRRLQSFGRKESVLRKDALLKADAQQKQGDFEDLRLERLRFLHLFAEHETILDNLNTFKHCRHFLQLNNEIVIDKTNLLNTNTDLRIDSTSIVQICL